MLATFTEQVRQLVKRVAELEDAIRRHCDQRGDDKCWLDDKELYDALGDDTQGSKWDPPIGDKQAFLRNCQRFVDNRCLDGKWKSYAELEAERDALLKRLNETEVRTDPAVGYSADQWVTLLFQKISSCRDNGEARKACEEIIGAAVRYDAQRLALVGAKEEREACAAVVDKWAKSTTEDLGYQDLAREIRARSKD